MIRLTAVLLLSASAVGCSSSRPLAGPQTAEALRGACSALTHTGGTYVRVDQITDRLGLASLGGAGLDSPKARAFAQAARDADGVWRYDATERMGSLRTGETGIAAIRGCEVVAQLTHVIYN